jgi:hypothetical protein
MAIDAVSAVHSSPVAQNIEAVDNVQRNPNPQHQSATLPHDRVTISTAAHAKQAASSGDKDHDGDSK